MPLVLYCMHTVAETHQNQNSSSKAYGTLMLVFLLDCLRFSKLLKLHQTEGRISRGLLLLFALTHVPFYNIRNVIL